MHEQSHPQAGQTVKVRHYENPALLVQEVSDQEYRLEDWWDALSMKSWKVGLGNPACIKYTLRAVVCGLPLDDEVVYGKIGPFGHLIHVSELVVDD